MSNLKIFSRKNLNQDFRLNYVFAISMLLDLSNEVDFFCKKEIIINEILNIVEKIKCEDFELYNKDTENILYKVYIGDIQQIKQNFEILNNCQYTHSFNLLIKSDIKELLPQFRKCLFNNEIEYVINRLKEIKNSSDISLNIRTLYNIRKFTKLDVELLEFNKR